MNWFIASKIGLEDASSYLWLLWRTSEAILNSRPLFYSSLLFYPHGAQLSFDAPILNSILGLPFYLCCGAVASYNFVALFTFIMTFLGLFLYLNYLVKSHLAALIGSAVFTFSAYRLTFLALGQLDLLSTQWIGFTLFYFSKYLDGKKAKTSLFLTSFFFGLGAYTDYRNFILNIILVLAITLAHFLILDRNSLNIWKYIKMWFLTFVFVLPAIIIHINNSQPTPNFIQTDSPQLWSSDLFAYIYPFANLAKYYFGLSIPFIGFISIVAIPIYFLVFKKAEEERKLLLSWTAVGIVFVLLSLGKSLNIFGNTINLPFNLPYGVFDGTPILGFFRAPVRFSFGVHLMAAVITALFFKKIFTISNRKTSFVIFSLSFLIAIFQNWYFVPKVERQEIFKSKAAAYLSDLERGTVINLPFGIMDSFRPEFGQYGYKKLMIQMTHRKPTIGGYVSYIPDNVLNDLLTDPFVDSLLDCQTKKICKELTPEEADKAMKKYNLKYVLVEKATYSPQVLEYLSKMYDIQLANSQTYFNLYTIEPKARHIQEIHISSI